MRTKIVITVFFMVVLLTAIGYVLISGLYFSVGVREMLFVDPETSVAAVGQGFAVNVNVSNVVDLYGWELKLRWNTTLLDMVNVSEGSFLKGGGDTYFVFEKNVTLGFVLIYCTLLGVVPGVNGSGGALATVEFQVRESGYCGLDIYDSSLVNSLEQSMNHAVVDGRFSSVPYGG